MRHPTSAFEARLASIAPGGFAIVMATGILSIAARLMGRDAIGWTLCIINIALYPAMWLALLARLACFPRAVLAALVSHDRGPGFLTTVAATAVLGSQCAVYGIAPGLLPWLLGLAAMLWPCCFTHSSPGSQCRRRSRRYATP